MAVKQNQSIRNICYIGAGYVGGPSGAVIAFKAPHITVNIVDVDEERISAWKSDALPVYEPDLEQLVRTARDGSPGGRRPNLFFSTDIDDAIKAADIIFLSINTPTKRTGLGAGKATDLGWLELAARRIGRAAERDAIVVEKSTVPCGTAAAIRQILRATTRPGVHLEVLSNPEFLAEGTAVDNLLNPDRVLIGSRETERGFRAAALLAEVYTTWIPAERIMMMNLWSSELSKLASNAMLAQRISSINALSAICEAVSANITDVSHVCASDRRIGSGMLKASVGFGGSCFKKDILNLVYIAESLGLSEVAMYWKSVIEINEYQQTRFTKRIVHTMHGNIHGKRIAVLGFAYKKDTGDTRESAAITIVNNLLAENATVAIFDPKVKSETILRDLQIDRTPNDHVHICTSPYEACEGAHAVVILTEWDMFKTSAGDQEKRPTSQLQSVASTTSDSSYDDCGLPDDQVPASSVNETTTSDMLIKIVTREQEQSKSQGMNSERHSAQTAPKQDERESRLDWQRIRHIMERPSFVFDGRNIVDASILERYGFHVESIGKATAQPS